MRSGGQGRGKDKCRPAEAKPAQVNLAQCSVQAKGACQCLAATAPGNNLAHNSRSHLQLTHNPVHSHTSESQVQVSE